MRYVALRVLQVLPTAATVVALAFILIHAGGADPVLSLAGEHGDAAYYAEMRARFGFDQPVGTRLLTYASRIASGDLGTSFIQGRPVADMILERAPATVLLTGTALLLSIVIGVPAGIFAARREGTLSDHVTVVTTLGLQSAPVFLVAHISLLVFAVGFGLPVQGMTSAGRADTGADWLLDVARHLLLPALVLGSQEIASLARLTRAGLSREYERDHVRTARAKGASEARVLWRHALPGVMLSLITVIGARVGHLLSGAAVVEIVFGWPGLGRLMLTALQARDTPVLMGLFFVVSLTMIAANLVTDLIYARLDPRVRFS